MSHPERAEEKPLVLIADDDETARLLMRSSLEQAGFEVIEAEDGAKALASFAAAMPQIVLLDVEMPNMNGFSACAGLRKLPKGEDIPVLMVTGHDDVDSVNRAYEAGATDFLSKPINWALLGHRVRYMLRASRTFRNLKASEVRLAKAQQMARLGHWEWQVAEDRWYFSEEVCRIIGVAPGNCAVTRQTLTNLIHPDDQGRVLQAFEAALRGEQAYDVEFRISLPDGSARIIHEQAEVTPNEKGSAGRIEGTLQDLTERRHAEERIKYLAYFDCLTGLPNRQSFAEQVSHALRWARRSKKPLALLFMDIDNFKSINDSLGHPAGDQLLRQFAARITQTVRGSDFLARPLEDQHELRVYRFGGDEFTLLLTDLKHEEDAAIVARRILGSSEMAIQVGGHELYATASIGISVFPSDGDDARSLLRNADSAMYHAKQKGKNTFEFYTESLTQISLERINLEAKLRKAMERSELKLHYQPRVEAKTGLVRGGEALLRWVTSGMGAVPPSKFIPLAEETGLIIPIGEWALREACQQIQAWQAAGLLPTTISVNLSPRQFRHERLAFLIGRILDETGLSPDLLELELTESAIMENVSTATKTLQELKGLGLRVAVDDFGTGYSSLAHLKRFPLDVLKIDRSFVRNVSEDPEDAAIVLAIIAMAHSLGLSVVAEGVENEKQYAFLRANSCDEIQGYLFSEPVSATEYARFIETSESLPRRILDA